MVDDGLWWWMMVYDGSIINIQSTLMDSTTPPFSILWWLWWYMMVVTVMMVWSFCPFFWCKKPQTCRQHHKESINSRVYYRDQWPCNRMQKTLFISGSPKPNDGRIDKEWDQKSNSNKNQRRMHKKNARRKQIKRQIKPQPWWNTISPKIVPIQL